ncbi:MAG: hypothetical protein A3J82_05785 [Elusimicrobia bacterium RIFOXYA2_FULL_69_6]|nr:MAG: hypothetical protein A3J82_05785 [Elusimicrobia bacterium RIFOXYA2_FULL_69_6]
MTEGKVFGLREETFGRARVGDNVPRFMPLTAPMFVCTAAIPATPAAAPPGRATLPVCTCWAYAVVPQAAVSRRLRARRVFSRRRFVGMSVPRFLNYA